MSADAAPPPVLIAAAHLGLDPLVTLRALMDEAAATSDVPALAAGTTRGEPGSDAGVDAAPEGLRALLAAWPKVELHVHLEGSMPPELLLRLAQRNRLRLPFDDSQAFDRLRRFRHFKDFSDLLLLGVQCLRTPEDFHDAVAAMGASMAVQNVRYAEVTWTPQLYARTGLPPDEILAAMNAARQVLQRRSGLQLRWIPDIVRSRPGPALAVAQWASSAAARAGGVVALGLGGPEAGHPADALACAFQLARARGLPANPHAGEGAGADSVWRTLDALQPLRIGHGVSAAEDPALMARLAASGVHLEVCPTSNVRLGLFGSHEQHPLKRLIDAGCSVSVNSDDPVLFGTTLTQEYVHAVQHCGLDLQTLRRTVFLAAQASHLPATSKQALVAGLTQEFERLDQSPARPNPDR